MQCVVSTAKHFDRKFVANKTIITINSEIFTGACTMKNYENSDLEKRQELIKIHTGINDSGINDNQSDTSWQLKYEQMQMQMLSLIFLCNILLVALLGISSGSIFLHQMVF